VFVVTAKTPPKKEDEDSPKEEKEEEGYLLGIKCGSAVKTVDNERAVGVFIDAFCDR
jgi:hypothetical protein